MMRLLDAKSSRWAIRHIYVVMALVGSLMMALMYPVGIYLQARNQELLDKLCIDEACIEDPNFMYYHDGGDAMFAGLLFGLGFALLVLSPIIAIGYWLIRRGVTFESLRLKGSNVA